MKQKLITLCFMLAACVAQANDYYQAYPITFTQTTNGTNFRLELSVYDSSLAVTQTFNTPYYVNIYNPTSSNGILIFTADNDIFASTDNFYGYITYDFIQHQWKDVIVNVGSFNAFNPSIYSYNNIVEITYDDYLSSDHFFIYAFYDLITHNWITEQRDGDVVGSISLVYENIVYISRGDGTDNRDEFFAFNPAAHQWTNLSFVFPAPTSNVSNGVVYSFVPFDPINFTPQSVSISTLNPANGTTNTLLFEDIISYSVNDGIYCVNDNMNTVVNYGKYDAQLNLWKTGTFPFAWVNNPSAITSWHSSGGVISFVNSTSTMVVNAAYNFNLHTWVYDSVPTPSVSAHAVTNGTVTWNNGSGTVTRGYSLVSGWSNNPTQPQASFYLQDLASPSAGNLVFVRDYSIGATSWSYDFGDGVVSTAENLFHLFKVGGSYLYSSPISANVCLTVTSPLGSNSTCNTIGCTPPTASITAGGPTTFCTGGNVVLSATTVTGYSYQWQLNSTDITGETNSSYTATGSGSYTCVVSNACGNATSGAISVTVNTGVTPIINNLTGPTYLCPGNTYSYSVTNFAGTTYNWSVPANATVSAGQGSNAVTITIAPGFASGSVCVNATNACATSLTKCKGVAKASPGRPAYISGQLTGLCGSTESYTAATVSGATGYSWLVSGGNILSGQGTQTVSVQWNNTGLSGSLKVAAFNSCGAGLMRVVSTALKPAVAAAITGPAIMCAGSTGNVFSIPATAGATSYLWQIAASGASITSGQGSTSITADWGSTSGNVYCKPGNACGTSQTKSIAMTVTCRLAEQTIADNLFELTAYPNPFNDEITITLNSSFNDPVIVTIKDVTGRLISKQTFGANAHYNIGKDLSNGVYFIEALQNSAIKSIKVLKSR